MSPAQHSACREGTSNTNHACTAQRGVSTGVRGPPVEESGWRKGPTQDGWWHDMMGGSSWSGGSAGLARAEHASSVLGDGRVPSGRLRETSATFERKVHKCIQGDAVRERTRETSGARHSRIRAQSAFREMQSGRYSQGEDSGKRLARALRHVCRGEMRTAPCELTSTMMTRSAIHLLCSTSPDSDACCPWHPTWLPLLALL